jgi:hypothetical protein
MKKIAIYGASLMLAVLALVSCEKENGVSPQENVYSYNLDLELDFTCELPQTVATRGFISDVDNMVAKTEIADTDRIVLFNSTKNVFACDIQGNPIYLKPIIEKGNNKTFFIREQVTFCRFVDGKWESVQVEADDRYDIFYQINSVDTKDPSKSLFLLQGQTGTRLGLSDFDFFRAGYKKLALDDENNLSGMGVIDLHGMTSKVVLKFKYRWESGDTVTVPASISKIMVLTTWETLAESYAPVAGKLQTNPLVVAGVDPDDGYCYISTIFDYSFLSRDKHDKLFIDMECVDAQGQQVWFMGHMDQPERGFEPGCVYVHEMELQEGQVAG